MVNILGNALTNHFITSFLLFHSNIFSVLNFNFDKFTCNVKVTASILYFSTDSYSVLIQVFHADTFPILIIKTHSCTLIAMKLTKHFIHNIAYFKNCTGLIFSNSLELKGFCVNLHNWIRTNILSK